MRDRMHEAMPEIALAYVRDDEYLLARVAALYLEYEITHALADLSV